MVWQSNIPQATDKVSVSQGDLLGDFTALNNFLQVDHEPFLEPNAGKHKKLTFPIQASSPATNISEIALFSRTSVNPAGYGPVLCLRKANSPAGIIEFSAIKPDEDGWTRMPNGNLLKWMKVSFVDGNTGLFAQSWPATADYPVFASAPRFFMVTPKANSSASTGFGAQVTIVEGTQTTTTYSLWIEQVSFNILAFDVYVFALGEG